MPHPLKSLLSRHSSRVSGGQGGGGRFRDTRFVSFLAANNRKTLNTDFQDAVLQGRRLFKRVLLIALAVGGIWIVVESAQALSLF